jgi:hypothetical protein
MSLASFAHWLAHTDWAESFSGSPTAYPIVMATHLTCIGLFGGLIFMTDLRLLGWALNSVPVSYFVQRLRPVKWAGFLIMVTCGALLAGSEAAKYYVNPYFWTKLSLLALIGVHSLAFRRSVYGNTAMLDRAKAMPREAKLAAALSLILWISVVCAGRMIGYYMPACTPRCPDALGTFKTGLQIASLPGDSR